jgi:hypothetical protein
LYLRIQEAERGAAQKAFAEAGLHPLSFDTAAAIFTVADSAAAQVLCSRLVQHLQKEAFWTASVDTFYKNGTAYAAHLYIGPQFQWAYLDVQRVEKDWLAAAGFKSKNFQNRPLSAFALQTLRENMLQVAENNGYPFASVWTDTLQVDSTGAVYAYLRADRGPYMVFRDIVIKGNLKLPRSFLAHYLGIRPGSPFSRAKVLATEKLLRGLAFADTQAPPTVRFAQNEANVQLYLNKKKAGRFDFIVGVLPRTPATNGETDGRVLITGQLDAAFQNAFNRGENFSIQMERLRPETQKLEVAAGLPCLLGTTFGTAGQLHIFRRDSTWLEARGDAGISYGFPTGHYVRFFWENRNLNLIRVDTAVVRRTRQLPPDLDLRQNGFGMEGQVVHLDDRFNPRRGWHLHVKGLAGFSILRRNAQIEAMRTETFDFRTLYDSIALRATRFRLEVQAEGYLALFRRSTLKGAFRAGGIFSDQPVYNNEQYRLGGHRLLRGFDEESLFATRYGVLTVEWRLLTGPRSFLSAFTDYGYTENLTAGKRLFLRPWGMGAGLNVETQAGIFGISLAVGRRDAGQSVDFRAAKFHLGYVSLF